MRKNLQEVISAFEAGRSKGKPGDSCWTDGRDVYSYNTCLVTRGDSTIILNVSRYSNTTSQQQSALRQYFPERHLVEVNDLPRGVSPDELMTKALADCEAE